MTSRKIAAFALLALLGISGWATSAFAYTSCTTTCYGNSCTTNCW